MATVRKRRGRWFARIKGADGKWHELSRPKATHGRAEAQRLAQEMEAREWRIGQGLQAPPSVEAISAASVRYLQAIRHHRSWPSIESRWRLHILPALGEVLVSQLTPGRAFGGPPPGEQDPEPAIH